MLLLCSTSLQACGVVVRGIRSGVDNFRNSERFHQGRHGALTEQELDWARIAWAYFDANYNPETGLVNALDGVPTTSMWQVGDTLAALYVAFELDFLSREQFDERISTLLSFLNTMPLFDGQLPNRYYHTKTEEMTNFRNEPQAVGWSAIDIGRLLIWLAIVAERYPQYTEYIHKVILRWSFCDIVDDCGSLYGGNRVDDRLELVQEGRLGYEEYAAMGFRAWGFNTRRASLLEPADRIPIYGIEVLHDGRDPRETGTFAPVVSLPFLLLGMEFNWDRAEDRSSRDSEHTDPRLAEQADRVYQVQEERYRREGIFTARTDHPLAAPPYFVYDSIFAAGYPWNTIADTGEVVPAAALVATRAVFPMWALYRRPYTATLLEVICPILDPRRGFYEGRRERTGGWETVLSATTNAMVLQALLYKQEGKLYRGTRTGHLQLLLADEFRRPQKCYPADREGCAP